MGVWALKKLLVPVIASILILGGFGFSQEAWGFGYVFSEFPDPDASYGPPESEGNQIFEDDVRGTLLDFEGDAAAQAQVDTVTHVLGYTGTGGVISITVGIDPTSANAAQMVTPVQNTVNTWNALSPTTGNLITGGANAIPFFSFDFESVMLHELGHALGLSHVNAATESGLATALQDYTKATDGANNVFDLNDGADNIIGSADDIRVPDDNNLNWYRTSNNNPITLASPVDSTNYARNIASLPGGDTFSANSDRTVVGALGFANTEGVMNQGTFNDEAQRTLVHDDVAGISYAMAGIDETAGNADDYTIALSFVGLTTAADIVVDFDNGQTGFAVASLMGQTISGDHIEITSADIFFNTGPFILSGNSFNWFFTPAQTTAVGGEFIPLDSTMVLVAGTQNTVAWMIPVIVSGIGFAIVIARKF